MSLAPHGPGSGLCSTTYVEEMHTLCTVLVRALLTSGHSRGRAHTVCVHTSLVHSTASVGCGQNLLLYLTDVCSPLPPPPPPLLLFLLLLLLLLSSSSSSSFSSSSYPPPYVPPPFLLPSILPFPLLLPPFAPGSPIIGLVMFISANAFFAFIDLTGQPQALVKYKIQDEKTVPVCREREGGREGESKREREGEGEGKKEGEMEGERDTYTTCD